MAIDSPGDPNPQLVIESGEWKHIDLVDDIFHSRLGFNYGQGRVARRIIAHITADRDHPIFNFQLQIVEHDAVANAVVAEFLGQLLEQHLIGDSSFYFDVVTHAFRVFHMADLAFGVQLVNIKLHKASPFP